MPASGFAFANPQPSPDNLNTTDPKDAYADDSGVQAAPVTEPIPAPWKTPEEMLLADVLGTQTVQQIQSAGKIVFHSLGDTGGIKEPSHQYAVADAMTKDFDEEADYKSGRPAFCYHLGDVVYYFGQERYYFDQFYDAYRDYDGPIFAIPGNHDGEMFPKEQAQYSLQAFYNNFCSKAPVKDPAAKGFSRTTMTQPGVYFTLNAPFVKIIGLYSNTGESTGILSDKTVGTAQLDFLLAQLQEAARNSFRVPPCSPRSTRPASRPKSGPTSSFPATLISTSATLAQSYPNTLRSRAGKTSRFPTLLRAMAVI